MLAMQQIFTRGFAVGFMLHPALDEKYSNCFAGPEGKKIFLTQSRKGAKRCRASKAFFASLRLCVKNNSSIDQVL